MTLRISRLGTNSDNGMEFGHNTDVKTSLSHRLAIALTAVLLLPLDSVAQRTAPGPKTNAAKATAKVAAPSPEIVSGLDRLRALGFWCDTTSNANSAANKQAIIAFQKIEHLKRTGKLDEKTLVAIAKAQSPACTDAIGLRHYEVDLNEQVLLVVNASNQTERVLSVSTGSGKWFSTPKNGGRYARTPRGKFKVFFKVAGWRKSELGELYYPLYVRGGVAIHGAPSVPAGPASHGCIRIPMFAARALFDMTPIGTIVIVYGENPKPS